MSQSPSQVPTTIWTIAAALGIPPAVMTLVDQWPVLLGSPVLSALRTPFLGDDSDRNNLSLEPLLALYEAGEFDLVGLGRSILSDPEWTKKMRSGELGSIRHYEKGHEQKLY